MTMHLVHPSLSMSGKRKGKTKFRNAEEAKRARQLDADWQQLQQRWGVEPATKRASKPRVEPLSYTLSAPVGRSGTSHIPSKNTGHTGATASKPTQQYTGTKMLGIGTLHKSNSVPIFTDEEAIDIAKMRR